MFNRIFFAMGVVAVSAMVLIGGSGAAKAAFFTWDASLPNNGIVVPGNSYGAANADPSGSAAGAVGNLVANAYFSDTYNFGVELPSVSLLFGMDTTYANPTFNRVGIANLEFNFYDSTGTGVFGAIMTDASGVDIPNTTNYGLENWYRFGLVAGSYSLVVTGDVLANGGAYTGTLTAVPLPPSAILFGTALFGIGALRRRKDKKATGLEATGVAA